MRRRDFVITAAALAGGGAGLFWEQQRIAATALYPGRDQGHWLRDARSLPEPTETLDTEVLIAGSGIAGLTAAWQLAKRGVHDVLLVSGPEPHGNAAAGFDGELAFPTGAHYLPLPSKESWHIREMLSEFGIIKSDPFGERPTFDERYLVHAPAERVLYGGAWQDGYLPSDDVSAAERADHERFFAMVDWYGNARGSDGRRAFVVPLDLSSADERFRALDRVTFKTWLDGARLNAPTLRWYVAGLTKRSGIAITLELDEALGRLPRELEAALFHIVQESLTNIHRHSGSRTAALRIARGAGRLLLEVEDQGSGIPADRLREIQTQGSGVGLAGMRERVLHFNGDIRITSLSTGTRIAVTFPVEPGSPRPESLVLSS